MGYPVKGSADYFALGDFNAACSMCGRKAKASTMVRNWQGLYRHPWHDEPRQPQDFARGVKDIMTVPWAQLEVDAFVEISLTFPALVTPSPLILYPGVLDLVTESTDASITTESGLDFVVESGFINQASVILPDWVIPVSYAWSWIVSGTGISIASPNLSTTYFVAKLASVPGGLTADSISTTADSSATADTSAAPFGVAQCIITDSLGGIARIILPVSVFEGTGPGGLTADSTTTADSLSTADE